MSPILHPTTPHRDERWTVLYTRGPGCAYVADLISAGTATRVDGDLKTTCIGNRANVLVTSRAGSFDLASTLVPLSVVEEQIPAVVVGAVGSGPHSPLVAATTDRLARAMGTEALLVTMSQGPDDDAEAEAVLAQMLADAPGAATRLVHADHPSSLVASLPPTALLVLGAPGGSWWQRQFFGAGRRLIHAAPAGSIVVRAAERRCFHGVEELTAVGSLMQASDAIAVAMHPTVPVVEEGRVVGQVSIDDLRAVDGTTPVGSLATTAVTAAADEPIDAVAGLAASLGGPVPVVDDDGRLLGGVTP